MPFLVFAADHLMISEIVLQPTDGEYILITNPTSSDISLENYYLSDGIDPLNGKYYYNLPSGANYWSGSVIDFIARFPNYNLKADSSLVLSLTSHSIFENHYATTADLALQDDMMDAIAGVSTIGFLSEKLDHNAESLILFYWDGTSTTVKDVDYLIWGDDSTTTASFAIDKSGVGDYQDDTPVASQSFMSSHEGNFKLIRNGDEGTETSLGGNGITGHDETSENLNDTWSVVDLTIVKPSISDISVSPDSPETTEDIVISADVTDDVGISSVTLTYTFPSDTGSPRNLAMTYSSGDTWAVTIPATGVEGELAYYITALNTSGLSESSQIGGVDIANPLPSLMINEIRETAVDDSGDVYFVYEGKTVTLDAVVSLGSGILRTNFTDMFIQDDSGFGIRLYGPSLLSPALIQGDSITVTALVEEFEGILQLTEFSYDLIAANRPVPAIRTVGSLEIATAENQGSFIKIWGAVQSRSDDIGGGSNVGIEDSEGLASVRIWDSTNLLDDPTADSLLQVGNLVQVFGIASNYNGDGQLLAGYATDIQAYKEGEDSDGETRLLVEPYPFVPQLAEVIQYSYKFPANSRVTLRIFDGSGRFVMTLFEDYRSLALEVTKTWDGRNEVYQIVPAGTYIMHLETVNRATGEINTDMAPVVIGSR